MDSFDDLKNINIDINNKKNEKDSINEIKQYINDRYSIHSLDEKKRRKILYENEQKNKRDNKITFPVFVDENKNLFLEVDFVTSLGWKKKSDVIIDAGSYTMIQEGKEYTFYNKGALIPTTMEEVIKIANVYNMKPVLVMVSILPIKVEKHQIIEEKNEISSSIFEFAEGITESNNRQKCY